MAKQRRNYSRNSYLPIAVMGMMLLGFLGLAGFSIAYFSGYFKTEQRNDTVDRTGQLAFPALARPVPAFNALTKGDFINPRTGQLNVAWLPESNANVVSRSLGDLLGRVLSRNKAAGLVLTEVDFLEKGTRPGLSAGVPVGKVAMSIPSADIPGLEQLRNGDRFDLMVSLTKQASADQISNTEPAALFGGIKPPSLRVGQLSRQHGVKQLVRGGMLVTHFKGAERSTTGVKGLTVPPVSRSRTTPPAKPVFAELAIDPEEIGPLTEAIGMGTKMTCVVRSGQPSESVASDFSTEGLVPVITTAKAVSAYSQLSDENLIDEATGLLHLYYFPADKVATTWIQDPTELYGRVVARSLRRGAFLTEADLLPAGTRPGISAGLPTGMSAMSIDKSNVQGFEKLSVGDYFSILTRVPDAVGGGQPMTDWATLQGGRLSEEDARVTGMIRTGIREIAHDAIYLSDPNAATVVIGVAEATVPSLAQLLRDGSEIFVVANSSRSGVVQLNSDASFRHANTAIHLAKVPVRSGSTHDLGSAATRRAGESSHRVAGSRVESPMQKRTEVRSATVRLVNQLKPLGVAEQPDDVAVPILMQDVPAFSEIKVNDLVDPATGRVRTLFFPRGSVQDDWILDPKQLVDRVAGRNLRAGRPVQSRDLAPLGTQPGPSSGLPQGMRGITVNSRQIVGLGSIRPGIAFDLVAARGVEVNALADSVRQSLSSSDAVREATKLPVGRVAASRTVATGAVLLSELGDSTILIQTGGAANEEQTETRITPDGSTVTETVKRDPLVASEFTVQRFVLAVPESQVGSVLGLLDIQDPLFVSLRPLPGNQLSLDIRASSQTVDAPVRAVIREHISGNQIRSEVFLTDRVEQTAVSYSGSPKSFSGESLPSGGSL